MIYGETAVEDAEGAIIVHSIAAGKKRFKKGRILSPADIETLRDADISTLITARLEADDIHEDIAAQRLAEAITASASATPGYRLSAPFTGRVNLISDHDGVVSIDIQALERLNLIDEAITIATVPAFERVRPRQMIATIKIIPFAAPEEALARCETIARASAGMIRVNPFQEKRIGFIQTETDHIKPSILDKTTEVLKGRLDGIGGELVSEARCPHQTDALSNAITALQNDHRPDILLIAGASAITDRRDVIPSAIEAAGGRVDHFGMPVDPGNLLLFGDLHGIPVIGMPGCARSPKLNGFDWVLERLTANIPIKKTDIMRMGVGGLLKEIETRPQPRAGQRETTTTEAAVPETAAPESATPETSIPAKTPSTPRAPRVHALLLAAGQSSRMGAENKLTARLGGVPMVRHVANHLTESGVDQLTVVSGHEAAVVEQALDGLDVDIVHNPFFSEGMSTSLNAGLTVLKEQMEIDAVLVALGDMPGVTKADIDRLIAAFNPLEGRAICIPTHRGKRGNPILFDHTLISVFEKAEGDIGARRLIAEREDITCEVEAGPGVLRDIDTPQALAAAQEEF